MGTWAEDRGAGFALMLDEAGALAFSVGRRVVSTRVAAHRPAVVSRRGRRSTWRRGR